MNDIKNLTIYNVSTDNRSLENKILICCNRSCEYEYDSQARWYYPAIMRTTTMDPLCEKYYSTSPYAWCGNNPINYVDPDGRDVYRYDQETGNFILYQKTDDTFDQVGKFKYNKKTREYEPKTGHDGSIKTYSDHLGKNNQIAKGILKNGGHLQTPVFKI